MTHKECVDILKRCNPSLNAYEKAVEILYCTPDLNSAAIYPIITPDNPYGLKIQFKGFDFRIDAFGKVYVGVLVPKDKDALQLFIKVLKEYYNRTEWESLDL